MSVVYEVIREDGSVVANLSEGEPNFTAFLCFYHLVRGKGQTEVSTFINTEGRNVTVNKYVEPVTALQQNDE